MTDKEEIRAYVDKRRMKHLEDDGGAPIVTYDSAMAREDEEILAYIDSMATHTKDLDTVLDSSVEELKTEYPDIDMSDRFVESLKRAFDLFYCLGKNQTRG